jgi:hypothetical protein
MKNILCAAALAAVLAGVGLADGDEVMDTVRLKDGSTIHGQVIEENRQEIVILRKGLKRHIGRDLVDSILFDSGPESEAPDARSAPPPSLPAPLPPPPPELAPYIPQESGDDSALYAGLAQHYGVPVSEVAAIHQAGIPVSEVPVVLLVAAHAHVAPDEVVGLRRSGMTWMDVTLHYNLSPGVFYVPIEREAAPAFDAVFLEFSLWPRWRWHHIVWRDWDFIAAANFGFTCTYWGVTPEVVVGWGRLGWAYRRIWLEGGHYGHPRGFYDRDERGRRHRHH